MDPFLAPGTPDFQVQDYSYQAELANTHIDDHKRQEGARQHQQMIEVCSPIVSSTSHPELKGPLNPSMVQLRGNYPVRQHDNNIGSIITMLIDDQGADLDDILTENRERSSEGRETRLESLQNEIKEEGCMPDMPDHLSPLDYPRPYPSPDYAYYQRDYVGQEGQEKDVESRSSLSSNSEGDDDLSRYSRATFDPVLSQTQPNSGNMATSPYMLNRDTGQALGENGVRKDDKYWERRRKNNLAAKKSRDARRVRENQLRLRVLCLENANRVLREQMDRKEGDLVQLRERLSKYETPPPPHTEHPMANM
eukprot:GFUD01029421.1.p1 GENE.GFUD01029421.1~~GFUD01029421.1.p1  ORF type:complete len:308 (-),score=110.98 GFUD01029421.1:735-1658(-)